MSSPPGPDPDATRPAPPPEFPPARPVKKRPRLSSAPKPDGLDPDQWIAALRRDFKRRWRKKRFVHVEDYLKRFPSLRENEQGVLDLIYQEVLLREQKAEAPGLEEYAARFPHLAEPLQKQFEVHALLGSNSAMELLISGSTDELVPQEPAAATGTEPDAPEAKPPACQSSPLLADASVADLVGNRRDWLDNSPTERIPADPPPPVPKRFQRRWKVAGLIGAALVAIIGVAVAGVALFTTKPSDLPKQQDDLARAEVRSLLHQAAELSQARDWQAATALVRQALAQLDRTPVLQEEFRQSALDLLAAAQGELAEKEGREREQLRQAQANRRRFDDLRSAVLLYAIPGVTLNQPADLPRAREAAAQAIAVCLEPLDPAGASPAVTFQAWVTHLSPGEQEEVRADCYELLLVWAEATARADPGKAAAENGLALLRRAAALPIQTRAGCLRRADLLERLGDAAGARAEREQAAGLQARLDKGQPGPDGHLPSKRILALDYYLLGLDQHYRGKAAAAIQDLEQAVANLPTHFEARYFLALLLLQGQQPQAAEAHFTICVRDRPGFLWSYVNRGQARTELGALARSGKEPNLPKADSYLRAAAADFHAALDLGPDDKARYAILVYRGAMHVLENDLDEARADLRAAMRLNPEDYRAHLALARALVQEKSWDEARAEFDRAIRQAPDQPELYRARAQLACLQGEIDAALADLTRASEREPPNSPASLADQQLRGQLLTRAGRYEEARAAFGRAIDLRPDLPEPWRGRAEASLAWAGSTATLLSRPDLYRQALADFDHYLKAAKKLEPDPDIFSGRGQARLHLGDMPGAVQDFTHALAIRDDLPTRMLRGWAYVRTLDSPRLALADFEDAVNRDPENAEAIAGRGYARVKLGSYRTAVDDADKTTMLNEKGPQMWFIAAQIYALAVEQVEADKSLDNRVRMEKRAAYQDGAVKRLRQALELLPDAQRRNFWKETVLKDGAFVLVRRSPAFLKLAAEYAD